MADTGNSQIDQFNDNNVALSTVNVHAVLSGADATAVDAEGDLYVADTGANRVAKYAAGGDVHHVVQPRR